MSKSLRVKRMKNTRQTFRFKTFNDGYNVGDTLVKSWNLQPNPPKVYVEGNRIHHGLVGLGLGILGLVIENPAFTGLGTGLAIDDIADIPDWFNSENNNSIQPQFQPAYVQRLQFHPVTVLPIGQSNEFV